MTSTFRSTLPPPLTRAKCDPASDLGSTIDASLEEAFLELGIVGFGGVALPIVAGLVLGEPILLVGGIGAAKTLAARRLGQQVMGCDVFRVYDASKSLFEDVIGLPIPQALAEGEVRYAPTPISITSADGVLIDELSRANSSMQNKWLEVIHSRTIMGLALPRLKVVLSAMNPVGFEGTFPLDEALAGRFTAVVVVPEVSGFSKAQRLQIIRSGASLALEEPAAGSRATAPRLRALLEAAREDYAALEEDELAQVALWANVAGRFLERSEAGLDGRRLGMLFRLGAASLAVAGQLLDRRLSVKEAGSILLRVLRGGLPFAATGKDLREPLLRAAHESGMASIRGQNLLGRLRIPREPRQIAALLLARASQLNAEDRQQAVTRLLEEAEGRYQSPEQRAAALIGLTELARALTRGTLRLPTDETHLVLRTAVRVFAWRNTSLRSLLGDLDDGNRLREALSPNRKRQQATRIAHSAFKLNDRRFPASVIPGQRGTPPCGLSLGELIDDVFSELEGLST
ncbi:MAG: AAA family ATPase [Planctomycetes bacterium]|nr:AAA family ATPase [Planctomycetota bacterium]